MPRSRAHPSTRDALQQATIARKRNGAGVVVVVVVASIHSLFVSGLDRGKQKKGRVCSLFRQDNGGVSVVTCAEVGCGDIVVVAAGFAIAYLLLLLLLRRRCRSGS